MLSIYQGNDKIFTFTRTDVNGNVITTEPQQIWFTVKKDYNSLGWVIRKTLHQGIEQNSDGSWNIRIDAIDTENIKSGKYVCDVKIRDEDGREITIVKPQDFAVVDVATTRNNQGG